MHGYNKLMFYKYMVYNTQDTGIVTGIIYVQKQKYGQEKSTAQLCNCV